MMLSNRISEKIASGFGCRFWKLNPRTRIREK